MWIAGKLVMAWGFDYNGMDKLFGFGLLDPDWNEKYAEIMEVKNGRNRKTADYSPGRYGGDR